MKGLKIFLKILVVFLPVILVWIFLAAFPASYMDGEYSYFTQGKDYRMGETELPKADILILGDSRAKSALIPSELSDTAMSLAEGGTTAVEAYFILQDYLEHMGTPKKVILSVSSYHFTSFDGFWTRSVYFDFLSAKQAKEALKTAASLGERGAMEAAGGKDVWTLLEYKAKSPTKYMSPLLNSFGENRRLINKDAYQEMMEQRGFKTFVSWWPTSAEHDMESFALLATLDLYYRKTIDLCIENGIEVYSVNTPLIADSYAESEKVWGPFRRYFEALQADYPAARFPKVHIETEFEAYDNAFFDDADHLNRKGAERYTKAWKTRWLRDAGGAS